MVTTYEWEFELTSLNLLIKFGKYGQVGRSLDKLPKSLNGYPIFATSFEM